MIIRTVQNIFECCERCCEYVFVFTPVTPCELNFLSSTVVILPKCPGVKVEKFSLVDVTCLIQPESAIYLLPFVVCALLARNESLSGTSSVNFYCHYGEARIHVIICFYFALETEIRRFFSVVLVGFVTAWIILEIVRLVKCFVLIPLIFHVVVCIFVFQILTLGSNMVFAFVIIALLFLFITL